MKIKCNRKNRHNAFNWITKCPFRIAPSFAIIAIITGTVTATAVTVIAIAAIAYDFIEQEGNRKRLFRIQDISPFAFSFYHIWYIKCVCAHSHAQCTYREKRNIGKEVHTHTQTHTENEKSHKRSVP